MINVPAVVMANVYCHNRKSCFFNGAGVPSWALRRLVPNIGEKRTPTHQAMYIRSKKYVYFTKWFLFKISELASSSVFHYFHVLSPRTYFRPFSARTQGMQKNKYELSPFVGEKLKGSTLGV
jgi:hypothetical protein